jgi:uncharacterized protein YndB with AHSA1/START domain
MTGWTGWMTTPNSCNNKEAAVTPERRASARMRVGGDYHFVFVAGDGRECSFRGTFLEVEPPTRTVETWLFDGWPGVEAVETRTTTTWKIS